MDKRGARPKSRRRTLRNKPGSKRRHRDVDYRAIDKGQSRPQVNRSRRANARETERDYWAAIDSARQARELNELRAIHNPPVSEESRRPSFSERLAKRCVNPGRRVERRRTRSRDIGIER